MKALISLFAFLFLLTFLSDASAHKLPQEVQVIVDEAMTLKGNYKDGKRIATSQCMFCHGMEGIPVNNRESAIPYIADQTPKYFVVQLAMFKTLNRKNPIMNNFADKLTAQDMANLREYYTSLKVKEAHCKDAPQGTEMPSSLNHVSDTMKKMVKDVEVLTGDIESGRELANRPREFKGPDGNPVQISCANCHGQEGVMEDDVRSATMHPDLASMGTHYTIRSLVAFKLNERYGGPMSLIMTGLNEQDIADLAAYYSSLFRCKN